MNRRPKLSLVSNRELNKRQALGFEATKQSGEEPSLEFEAKGADSIRETLPRKPFQPEQLVASNRRDDQPENSGWPNGGQLAKAVVAVVAVALSIYLLKRRFF